MISFNAFSGEIVYQCNTQSNSLSAYQKLFVSINTESNSVTVGYTKNNGSTKNTLCKERAPSPYSSINSKDNAKEIIGDFNCGSLEYFDYNSKAVVAPVSVILATPSNGSLKTYLRFHVEYADQDRSWSVLCK
jgi:hypothetical protein